MYKATGTATYNGTFDAPEMKIVSGGATGSNGKLTVGFDENAYPVWNIHEQMYFFPDEERGYMGWVRIEGQPKYDTIQAHFNYNERPVSDSVFDAFVAYLNNGLSASGYGVQLSRRTDESVEFNISVDLFSDLSYQMFGWGLNHFNDLHNVYISLEYLSHVPELATWLLLLPRMFILVAYRWRKRQGGCN